MYTEETEQYMLNMTKDYLQKTIGQKNPNKSYQIATEDDLTRFKSIFPEAFKELYSLVKSTKKLPNLDEQNSEGGISEIKNNTERLDSERIRPNRLSITPDLISINVTPNITPRTGVSPHLNFENANSG